MSDSVFKGVEIVGTSYESFSHAIEVAVTRARQTLRNLSWFVVEEQRGGLQQDRLQYQVTLRVYFKLEDGDSPDTAGDEADPSGT
jgi:flavin-binding protein dodecin